MFYYKIAIIGNSLSPLTYQSRDRLDPADEVLVPLKSAQKNAIVLGEVQKPSFVCKCILEKRGFFSDIQFKLMKFISNYYVCSMGEACGIFTSFTSNDSFSTTPFRCKERLTLSSEQKNIKEKIKSQALSLLFGDTGSGKTEIYISLMLEELEKGNSVIFLMPEISLTPQMKKRLSKYFGDLVAIWHSKISKKKKQSILHDLQKGKIRVIAGARSALFLPIKNLSLIIVDEEHDESYKSSSNPRYNARDLSLMYGKISSARVVLGSGTPSLTSFSKLPFFRLEGTYFKSHKSFIYENAHNQITPFMLSRIENALSQNYQVIIFVPTRANFKYLTCKECGENIKCPFCEVGMSLHSKLNALKCHYCNFTLKIPNQCPNCKDQILEANRIGTAQIAKELQEIFTDKNIQIFDRDEVKTQKALKSTLKDFNDKKIHILVGTQMLSKGHDYHGVALSVILGIDSILATGDYRSREKALSLSIQVAGRAGRKGKGEVFIQTQNEEFFKTYMEDYEKFLKDELTFRKNLYPPYKKLLCLKISHTKEQVCQEITNELVNFIKTLPFEMELVGYGVSNISKIASKYRYEILLRSSSAKPLIQAAFTCKRPFVQADMDPLSFS
ncbi:MAG: primosomal protein N' [Proteobacteria bacterium]|nr:MAG: primosomal protein N' [Pseudomonadota bacterium]